MRPFKIAPLLLCLALAACASAATPEDAQMASALCMQGKVLLSEGKDSDARDIYASAVQRDDNNPRAWNGLGASYDLLGKMAEAKDAYQHAHELAPDDANIANNLGHAYLESGDADAALSLLQTYNADPAAPAALRQNLAAAAKAVAVKDAGDSDVYADLGSYPTEGMAQGHIAEARQLIDDDSVILSIAPEVKVGGGTPVFTLRATGRSPQAICEDLMVKAFPCVPQGK